MFHRGIIHFLLLWGLALDVEAQVAQKPPPLPQVQPPVQSQPLSQPDGCLSMQQIIRMQESELEATRLFLDAQGWDFTGSSQDQSYRFMEQELPYHLISWQHRNSYGRLTLYYYPGKEHIVRMEPDEACFRFLLAAFRQSDGKSSVGENRLSTLFKVQNLNVEFTEASYGNNYTILLYPPLALTKEARVQIATEEAAKRAAEDRNKRYREALQRGDIAYEAGRYAEARSAYVDARMIEENEDVRERIEACDLAMCKTREARADSAYRAGNYELARTLYYDARACSQNKGNIDTKIRLMESKIKEEQVRKAREYADGLFDAKRYAPARNAYEELLRIDPGNSHAKSRLESIKSITQFLMDRGRVVYSYQKENAAGMLRWKQSVAETLNRVVMAAPEGSIKGDFSLRFDTSGVNKSSFRIQEGGTPDLNTQFQSLSQASVLSAPKQRGYFIAAKEDVSINLQWKSSTYSVWSDVSGMRFDKNFPAEVKGDVERYLSTSALKHGDFRIQVKEKTLNERRFSDLLLLGYKTKAGPGSAMYSLLWPGLGTYRASYGAQGKGAAKWFLYCAGTAVLSGLYAKAQYNNYQNATSQADMDYYYDRANLGYKTALVSGGLAATIYVHNIFAAWHRGSRNQRYSRDLRTRLRKEPIIIKSQAITLP
ncbi:MAG: hypothetical protein KJS92_05395 [Bacteroidetes bacterium]|nr:hypothetical protein [Bacteroidota bacterium]